MVNPEEYERAVTAPVDQRPNTLSVPAPCAPAARAIAPAGLPWRRILPLAAIAAVMVAAFASGLHNHLSLETLVRHRMAIESFIAAHGIGAVAVYTVLYILAVALSLPGAVVLTVAGGALFGAVTGGIAAIIGATIGATIVFLIARSAIGEALVRGAGPRVTKVTQGFCAHAFSYLLFLRLVPAFPFWLVNLAPALAGVKLPVFVAATAIGIIPGTFAFAFLGAGLDSVIAAQEALYRDCLAAGRTDCVLNFDLKMLLTPQLLAAFVVLGFVALIPVAVKWHRSRVCPPKADCC
jgi:uncharacterized membrane protein YdjX (TVP38/TMEM64 family)